MKTFIAEELPDKTTRIIVNDDLLRPYPSGAGMMHDELMVGHPASAWQIRPWALPLAAPFRAARFYRADPERMCPTFLTVGEGGQVKKWARGLDCTAQGRCFCAAQDAPCLT
jgi:hypothetical protein